MGNGIGGVDFGMIQPLEVNKLKIDSGDRGCGRKELQYSTITTALVQARTQADYIIL